MEDFEEGHSPRECEEDLINPEPKSEEEFNKEEVLRLEQYTKLHETFSKFDDYEKFKSLLPQYIPVKYNQYLQTFKPMPTDGLIQFIPEAEIEEAGGQACEDYARSLQKNQKNPMTESFFQ